MPFALDTLVDPLLPTCVLACASRTEDNHSNANTAYGGWHHVHTPYCILIMISGFQIIQTQPYCTSNFHPPSLHKLPVILYDPFQVLWILPPEATDEIWCRQCNCYPSILLISLWRKLNWQVMLTGIWLLIVEAQVLKNMIVIWYWAVITIIHNQPMMSPLHNKKCRRLIESM